MSLGTKTEFEVHLENFTGPFDLLLSLIYKRKLDVTQLALAQVTDEFLSYLPRIDNFSEASEFLVVAATLLDMKAARLLPRFDEDTEIVPLLEEADLLFSRLLRYRAFKIAAQTLAQILQASGGRLPRQAPLPEELERALPPLKSPLDPTLLAQAYIGSRNEPPEVGVEHIHHPPVSVASQEEFLWKYLEDGPATFTQIIENSESIAYVVARFLAALTLYRDGKITLHQDGPERPIILQRRLQGKTADQESISHDHQ